MSTQDTHFYRPPGNSNVGLYQNPYDQDIEDIVSRTNMGSNTFIKRSRSSGTLRCSGCNPKTVAVIGMYVLFSGVALTGVVLMILQGNSALTKGLIAAGAGGIGLETLLLLLVKCKAKYDEWQEHEKPIRGSGSSSHRSSTTSDGSARSMKTIGSPPRYDSAPPSGTSSSSSSRDPSPRGSATSSKPPSKHQTPVATPPDSKPSSKQPSPGSSKPSSRNPSPPRVDRNSSGSNSSTTSSDSGESVANRLKKKYKSTSGNSTPKPVTPSKASVAPKIDADLRKLQQEVTIAELTKASGEIDDQANQEKTTAKGLFNKLQTNWQVLRSHNPQTTEWPMAILAEGVSGAPKRVFFDPRKIADAGVDVALGIALETTAQHYNIKIPQNRILTTKLVNQLFSELASRV